MWDRKEIILDGKDAEDMNTSISNTNTNMYLVSGMNKRIMVYSFFY